MKSKVTEWGNSHGIRVTNAMMSHLNVKPGEELEVKLTSQGIEIVKTAKSVDYLNTVKKEVTDTIISSTEPVSITNDPYVETDVAYLVVGINPNEPIIREVSRDTDGAYKTLADAKEAARKIIQKSINEAKESLVKLRQLGIEKIHYIG